MVKVKILDRLDAGVSAANILKSLARGKICYIWQRRFHNLDYCIIENPSPHIIQISNVLLCYNFQEFIILRRGQDTKQDSIDNS
jgi:hypothetical protein